jgi:hypothetical protein
VPDRLRPALGLVVAAAALALTGCGGSGGSGASSSTSTPGPGVTKASFVARARAICTVLHSQENALRARQAGLRGLAAQSVDTAFVALVGRLVADSRAAEHKLRALAPPAGGAKAVEGLLNALSEQANYATGIARAAANQESALGETAEQDLKASVARSSAHAAEFGMKGCIDAE